MAAAKSRAQRTKCLSNLRQVFVLEHCYSLDHDGAVPLGYRTGAKQFNTMVYSGTADKFVLFGKLWTEQLLDQPQILYCPAETRFSESLTPPSSTSSSTKFIACSFGSR